MNSAWSKWIILVLIAGVTLAADLASKRWAEDALANPEHPLTLVVGEQDGGKTLGDLARARLGETFRTDAVYRLTPGLKADPEARIIDSKLLEMYGALLLFTDPARIEPPFLVTNRLNERLRKARLEGSTDLAGVRSDVQLELKDISVQEYVADQLDQVAKRDIGRSISAGLMHAYPSRPARMEEVVKPGEVYLLFDRKITIVDGLLRLIYAENPGAAWGFLANAGEGVRRTFLGGVTLLAMFFILYMFRTIPVRYRASQVAFALILGGAAGNFVDRLMLGFVVDFIDMYVKGSHWPTYNVADIAISVGVGLILLEILRKRSPFEEPRGEKAA